MDLAFAGMDTRTLVVLAGVGLSVVFVFLALRTSPGRSRRHLKQRLNRVGGGSKKAEVEERIRSLSVKKRTTDSMLPGLDLLIKQVLPHPELLRERLRRTGYEITISEYVLVNVLLMLTTAYALHTFVGLPWAVAMLAGIAAGVGLPHMMVGMMVQRRLKKFTALFPEAIDLIVRGLKSGLPVSESIKVVGEEIIDPVGVEFRHIADSMKLGRTMEDAMWDAARRLDTPEFKFFVISLSVQRETGGNLTETLENLSEILRKRRQMRVKVKAMSSEARASAMIIGSLPFIMFAIIFLLNRGYVMQLFTDPRGIMMVAFGLTSMSIGILVMAKMIRFEI